MTSVIQTRRNQVEAGQTLRALRMNRGLSPEALGHLVGVSGRQIRRIEAGARPTARVAFALVAEFDLEVTDLWL